MPANVEVLLDRGPYTVAAETKLLRSRRIDVLVTKNSGGALTEAKLAAARDLGLPVVMVQRPVVPPGVDGRRHGGGRRRPGEGWVIARARAWVAGDRPLRGTVVVRGALHTRYGRQRW